MIPKRVHFLANSNGYGTTEGSDTKLTKEEIKALHFDVARLPDTNIDGKQHGYVQEVYKNISQRLRVCVEYVLVILSLALHISPFSPDNCTENSAMLHLYRLFNRSFGYTYSFLSLLESSI